MPHTAERTLRHWHWLIWLSILLAAGLAWAATLVRPPVYEASTLLSIDESQSATQGFDVAIQADQFLAQRFIAMGTSRDVLQAVCAREAGACDPAALARQVRVTTPRATAQLEIAADASSPEAAARLANEAADALIARNRAQIEAQLQSQRTYLQGQVRQLNAQIAQQLQQSSAAEAAGHPDAAGLAQLSFLQTQYSTAYQRLQDLDVQASQRADVLSVEQRAMPPRTPVDPDPVRYLLVGVVCGLGAGVLAALLAERLRQRIRDASDLAAAAGTDVVIDLNGGRDGATAARYGLLGRLGRAAPPGRPRALWLVASTPRDRVNDVAAHLAQAATAGHQRVLVVPAQYAAAVDRDSPEGDRPSAFLLAPEGGRGGPGAAPERPEEEIDLVVHCLLPPMQTPAAEPLGPAPDSVILVATRGRTTFTEARLAAGLLRAIGVEVAAAALLPVRPEPVPVPAHRSAPADRVPAAKVAAE
ncbi:MAG TPA: Wzz/FepE/Etk N-terminal domain-containing protein [Candidatus Dormibacteraeota bacterium]|nr:Wzz/FepE/Etk N-terminal domain-containing protein [Candidatus Dormibacteraeota bacterium]